MTVEPNMDQLADVVVATVKAAMAPMQSRVESLERRSIDALLERIAVLEHRLSVVGSVKDGTPGLNGKDGTSVTVEDVRPMVETLVQKAIEAIPTPRDGQDGAAGKDGTSVTVDELRPLIDSAVLDAVALIPKADNGQPGRDGIDGKSVSIEDVTPVIESLVHQAVATIPTPKDGRDGVDGKGVTVDDIAPLVATAVKQAVSELPQPKEPIGFKSALIDREGRLVFSFTDGSMQDVGVVVGKNVDPDDVARLVAQAVNEIPRPKDGEPGRDGSLENLVVTYDGERTITLSYKNGDPVQGGVIKLPIVLDRGVYDSTKSYESGDGVSYDGSFWIAKADTVGKQPKTNDGAGVWRLAVKSGRNGKDGIKGIDGKDGKDSRDVAVDIPKQGRPW